MKNPHWLDFFQEAKEAFSRGEGVFYPGLGQLVGPDFTHTVLSPIQKDNGKCLRIQVETKTLAEWIEELDKNESR